MSVPASKRKKGTMEVFVRARDMVSYTLLITSNQKVFTPPHAALTARIADTATAIGEDLWCANSVRVANPGDLARRRAMQQDAVDGCNRLMFLIGLAAKDLHLRKKRVHHWSGMVDETRRLIRAWSESDARRYGDGVSSPKGGQDGL